MEEQLSTTQPTEQTKRSGNRKLFLSLGAVVVFIIIILTTFFILKSISVKKDKIAPSSETLVNPLNIQVALGFSTYNLSAVDKKPVTVDINLQTVTNEGVSGGTVIVTYDPYVITNVSAKPIIGSTGIFPSAIFSDIKYNPNNVTIIFSLPSGNTPATGNGRIAQFTFTPKLNDSKNKTAISFDLKHSEIYTMSNGIKKVLKPSKGDLDVTITQ